MKTDDQAILDRWARDGTYAKAKERSARGEPFYFLDGPPYTSGKVHLGTAWNKVLKDVILRYKRMRGRAVWDRAGYDMHGLPTEHATQKQLGLATKEEIERYGVGKFIAACKKLCLENLESMNRDFTRLGVWMDFENAYQSITDGFIEGEWWLVKRAHEEGRLYEGLKTMTWCPDCASALAKHECDYQSVTEPSIFVKLPVAGKEDTYLVIWTTTPWTIPFNLAVMANPDLDYVEARVQRDGTEERWILAAALAGPVIQSVADATYAVERTFKGAELEGMRYRHPFAPHLDAYALIREEAEKLHTVLMSAEHVDTSAGSGLVHCAPGCGPEDFEVGHRNGLPPYNTLDETGRFPESMGPFAGKVAKKDDAAFIDALGKAGALIATVDVEHDYPHCWRHHTPVIFRATKQWFFKVEDLKERMVAENDRIAWQPRAAYNAFDSWLRNLRDNSITKQRYWGTPLPVWRCDACGHDVVVGSKAELQGLAGTLPPDLHKPAIDDVTWPCHACTGTMRRIPDILDVWVDAGTVSWNALDYPARTEEFDRLFPADLILEGKDQIRGWFNLLHVASMIAHGRPCFTHAYMHGFINDSQGRKMSKSEGNYILPEEVVGKYGADTFRLYAVQAAAPGLDMNYNPEEVELKHRNLGVFRNIANFLLQLRRGTDPGAGAPGPEERYLTSRVHSTIKAATERLEAYDLPAVPPLVERLLLDLSRNYLQLVRDKAAHGTDEERAAVLGTAFAAYDAALTLLAPITPLFAEEMHGLLREPFGLAEESVHLRDWPAHDDALIDAELERDTDTAFAIIGAVLSARDEAKLGVRWPAAEAIVTTNDETAKRAVDRLKALIQQHTNIKRLTLGTLDGATWNVEPNYRNLGKAFGTETTKVAELIKRNADKVGTLLEQSDGSITLDGYELTRDHVSLERRAPDGWSLGTFPHGAAFLDVRRTPELEAEGYARELIRRVQQLRKEAGLQKEDAIDLGLDLGDLDEALAPHLDEVRRRTGAAAIVAPHDDAQRVAVKGKTFAYSLRKR